MKVDIKAPYQIFFAPVGAGFRRRQKLELLEVPVEPSSRKSEVTVNIGR
jgi:hypothetical protein